VQTATGVDTIASMIRLDDEHLAEAVAGAFKRRVGSRAGGGIGIRAEQGTGLAAIYLFGSFAKGTQRRGSDVDLAVLTSERIGPVVLHELTQDVAVAIGRDVHFIDLRAATTVMAAAIVGEGRPIAIFDRVEAESFAARTLAEYAYLNEIRRPAVESLLAPYRERGTSGVSHAR